MRLVKNSYCYGHMYYQLSSPLFSAQQNNQHPCLPLMMTNFAQKGQKQRIISHKDEKKGFTEKLNNERRVKDVHE